MECPPPPPCFKNPISERVFFSMRDDSLHTVHSGAIDSKGHQGVLLGKRWFLSLPCEQSHPSGCHFRASWNNLQFIAAVVALNWSWAHFANASATSLVNSTERSLLWGKKKIVSWAINVTKGVMFVVLTIHKLFLQVEMSHLPAKMEAKHVCVFADLKSTMMKWN